MALSQFSVKRHFSGLDALMHVDCSLKEVHLTMRWKGLITAQEQIPFWEACTPDKAEQWLSRPMGQYASVMECLYARYRALAA